MPGVGTTIVTAPAIVYLFFTGPPVNAIGLLIWSMLVVGLVDNLIGPYLISRGNNLHPFIILISVLGGISLIGPVGFVIGPVVVTLFYYEEMSLEEIAEVTGLTSANIRIKLHRSRKKMFSVLRNQLKSELNSIA